LKGRDFSPAATTPISGVALATAGISAFSLTARSARGLRAATAAEQNGTLEDAENGTVLKGRDFSPAATTPISGVALATEGTLAFCSNARSAQRLRAVTAIEQNGTLEDAENGTVLKGRALVAEKADVLKGRDFSPAATGPISGVALATAGISLEDRNLPHPPWSVSTYAPRQVVDG